MAAASVYIPVQNSEEEVRVALDQLPRDATDILDILKAEQAPLHLWLIIAIDLRRRIKLALQFFMMYLRNTKDMFLVYGGNPSTELRVECYCDAGFETDRDDTKSQTGYVFVLNGGAVDWKSSKQSTTAMSAIEF
ncbi:retrotransposon protein, putative, ty1-copia subclass [Tanacetum coccineum]